MLAVVYDTNIYISGIVLSGQITQLISLARENAFDLYVSPHILEEIREVITDKFKVSPSVQKVIFRRIRSITILTYPTKTIKIVPSNHPDNQILACCDSCNADYLVTGDKKHLLPLKKFHKTKIITPQEFLAIIEQ